jgi:hypothetical protein
LLDLILEEIGCFNHCEHHNKSPAHRGLDEPKTLSVGSCSDVSRKSPPCLPEVPSSRDRRAPFYLQLTIQAYGSAHGRRCPAPAPPILRLVDVVQTNRPKRPCRFRLRQLRLQMVRRRPQRFTARRGFRTRLAGASAGLESANAGRRHFPAAANSSMCLSIAAV